MNKHKSRQKKFLQRQKHQAQELAKSAQSKTMLTSQQTKPLQLESPLKTTEIETPLQQSLHDYSYVRTDLKKGLLISFVILLVLSALSLAIYQYPNLLAKLILK